MNKSVQSFIFYFLSFILGDNSDRELIRELRRRRRRMIRDEAVPRDNADSYLFTVLCFFLLSLLCTKLFMGYLYDDVGSIYIGGLHIHHHFFGAVLIVLAAIWGIYYSNEVSIRTASVMLGAGLGIFIDEMGEYMTDALDYWWKGSYSMIYVIVIVFIIMYVIAISFKKSRKTSLASGLHRIRDYFTTLTRPEALEIKNNLEARVDELRNSNRLTPDNIDLKVKLNYYEKQLEFINESLACCRLPDIELPESRIRRGIHGFLKSKRAFNIATYLIQVFGCIFIAEGVFNVLRDQGVIFVAKFIFVFKLSPVDIYSGFILGSAFILIGLLLRKHWKWIWFIAVGFTLGTIFIFGIYGFYANPNTTLISVTLNGILLLMLFQPEIKNRFLH